MKTIVKSSWHQAGQIAAVFNGLRQRDLMGVKSGSKTWSDYRIRLPDTSDHLSHPNLLALIRSFLAHVSIKKRKLRRQWIRQAEKDIETNISNKLFWQGTYSPSTPVKVCTGTNAYVLHSSNKEIDLDIGKKEESLSNYRATLAHKCCHSFKPNSHFAQFRHSMWVPTTSLNLLNSSTYPGTAWWRPETWSPARRSLSPTTMLSPECWRHGFLHEGNLEYYWVKKKMHIFDFFRDIFSVFGAFRRFFGCKIWFSKILSV